MASRPSSTAGLGRRMVPPRLRCLRPRGRQRRECEEGQIFIEPQGMCVMAGIGVDTGKGLRDQRCRRCTDTSGYQIRHHAAAACLYQISSGAGRDQLSYPPGYKENAGIFLPQQPLDQLCRDRRRPRGDRAFEVYRKDLSCLSSRTSARSTAPSLTSTARWWQAVTPPAFGEAKNSWLTGTAAWTFVDVSQYILGVQPTLAGLKIDPCLPHEMDGFTLRRVWRGATYEITVDNTAHAEKGVASMTVNGQPVPTNTLSPAPAGTTVQVKVVMG